MKYWIPDGPAAVGATPPVVHEVKILPYSPGVAAPPAKPTFAARTLAQYARAGEKVLGGLARELPVHLK